MGLKKLCLLILLSDVFVAVSGDYKVVCYLGSGANYRSGDGKFVIENINPKLCTHVIYGFAKLDNNQIAANDPYLDLEDDNGLGAYSRFNGLKKANPQLKTLIAIGGWNEGSTKYSQMASNPTSRGTFVKSVVDFCKKYGFDGLDVDWEYPANRGGAASDKENYVVLLKYRRLKESLKLQGLLLSAAVAAGKSTIDTAYDVPKVSKYLDFINVMAHDFHGAWENATGHSAPLYPRDEEPEQDKILNVKFAVDYWINKGAPRDKLVMGMGMYGKSFTLANPSKHGLGAPTAGPGQAGPMTEEPGTLGYNEICLLVKQGWKEVFVPKVESPYAFFKKQWVGYDNKNSIEIKVDYLMKEKLGGGMVWFLDTDDFLGKCGEGKYPLLSTISKKLSGGKARLKRNLALRTTSVKVRIYDSEASLECTKEGYFRDDQDCGVFYRCVKIDGRFIKYTYSCPWETAFDEETTTCINQDYVPGC